MCSYFKPTQPCANCPYRKDAALQLWHREEFARLLANDKLQFAPLYNCHKKNGQVCVGWLMNQDERGLPNINLRIKLFKENITAEYLDSLNCSSKRYDSVEKTIESNFLDLLNQ